MREFEPQKSTYVVRIFSSWHRAWDRQQIRDSSFYTRIREYIFDDVEPQSRTLKATEILFTPEIAQEIIQDFVLYKDSIEALVVHCSLGRNRSPAVAIALNEIFELGYDTKALKKQYNEANWHVYDTLITTAQKG